MIWNNNVLLLWNFFGYKYGYLYLPGGKFNENEDFNYDDIPNEFINIQIWHKITQLIMKFLFLLLS